MFISPSGETIRRTYNRVMDPAIALVFLGVFVLVTVAAFVIGMLVGTRRQGHRNPDVPLDPEEAARRARGTTAWMGPDGGGGI